MHKIVIISLVLVLVSCASVPANFGDPSPSSRIGLLLLIDDYPKREHVGPTAFQNSEENNATKTNFKNKFYARISNVLDVKEYDLVLLKPDSTLVETRFDLYSYMSSNIHFKGEVASVFDQYAAENDLDFIVVVHPLNGPAWVNSSAYIDGYGLYTRCGMVSCEAEVLDHVNARVYDTEHKSSLKSMGFRYFRRPEISGVELSPGDLSVPDEIIDMAADKALDKFMNQFSAMLVTSGFIE